MKDNLNDYLKTHKHKEDSFLLGNIAGYEWQMVKEGKFYSACAYGEETSNLVAIHNRDGINDSKMLKKKLAAILRQNIHNSITAIEKLAAKADYKDFSIDYDEMLELVKLKSYELFEN